MRAAIQVWNALRHIVYIRKQLNNLRNGHQRNNTSPSLQLGLQ